MLCNQYVETFGTIPNTEPNITVRDSEGGACMLIDVAISGDKNVVMREADKILKCREFVIEIKRMFNAKTKMILLIRGATQTSFKIIQKISEKYTGKARNKGNTENRHIGHCKHTLESANVQVH
jgi:hypothetical protein